MLTIHESGKEKCFQYYPLSMDKAVLNIPSDSDFGDDFKVECPVGSGKMLTLWEVSIELSRRLTSIYQRDLATGQRAVFGPYEKFRPDPNWNGTPFFHEYFHADTGRGCGASHQTGWTGLIAKLLQQTGEYRQT